MDLSHFDGAVRGARDPGRPRERVVEGLAVQDEVAAEGRQLVTDGPYAEAKEALGGNFIQDCESLDDALAWAARIPGASHGAVEVRQVHVDEEA